MRKLYRVALLAVGLCLAVTAPPAVADGHDKVMRDAQAGAPVLPAVADPERTCRSPAFASPTDHAVIRHTETFKTAADDRHWISWRLRVTGEGWNFGSA